MIDRALKRPPSLSDSLIYMGNLQQWDPLDRLSNHYLLETHFEKDLEIQLEAKQATQIADKICEYSLLFLIHITLISIFETLFFFAFVSKDEDTGILSATNYYTNSIINGCVNLTLSEQEFLSKILEKFINSSTINEQGLNASKERMNYNTYLLNLSCGYIAILFSGIICVGGYANYHKIKSRWKYIISENLVLVSLLGLYEFMYFMTIIKHYSTESSAEISLLFVEQLHDQCNIL